MEAEALVEEKPRKRKGRPRKIKAKKEEKQKVEELTQPTIRETIKLTDPKIDLSFKTVKRNSLAKTAAYNNILNYVVDNFGNWDVSSRGTYYLNSVHTIEYDGYSLPVVDDKYLLSDILTEKMPEDIIEWLEALSDN